VAQSRYATEDAREVAHKDRRATMAGKAKKDRRDHKVFKGFKDSKVVLGVSKVRRR
jgi:hypothetical protein